MTLPNPVWPEVKVCQATHAVAFRNAAEAKSYYERYCPSILIKELYLCDSCRQFHAVTGDAKPPKPSSKDYQKAFHELKTKL